MILVCSISPLSILCICIASRSIDSHCYFTAPTRLNPYITIAIKVMSDNYFTMRIDNVLLLLLVILLTKNYIILILKLHFFRYTSNTYSLHFNITRYLLEFQLFPIITLFLDIFLHFRVDKSLSDWAISRKISAKYTLS